MSAPYKAVASTKQLREGDMFDVIGSILRLYRASWNAFLLNWQTFIVLYILPACFAIMVVPLIVVPVASGSWSGYAFATFTMLVLLFVVLAMGPATIIAQLASAKGEKINFGDAFSQGIPSVWRYTILNLLLLLIVSIGLLLLIPGLIALFLFGAAPYLLISRNLTVGESMRQSIEFSKTYWKAVLGAFVIFTAISVLSSSVPIGSIAAFALFVLYFCAPALVITKINIENEAVTVLQTTAEKAPKKTRSPKSSTKSKKTKKS